MLHAAVPDSQKSNHSSAQPAAGNTNALAGLQAESVFQRKLSAAMQTSFPPASTLRPDFPKSHFAPVTTADQPVLQRALNVNATRTQNFAGLAAVTAHDQLASGHYAFNDQNFEWYRVAAQYVGGLFVLRENDGSVAHYNIGTATLTPVAVASFAELFQLAGAIANTADLSGLLLSGFSTAQLLAIFAVTNNGATIAAQLGLLTGHLPAGLLTLYNDHISAANISALLAVEPAGNVLHTLIGRIQNGNADHLLRLYNDHATSAQIATLFNHETDGDVLHTLITRITDPGPVANLLLLYARGNSGQLNTLLQHEGNAAVLLQIMNAVNASAPQLTALYVAGANTQRIQELRVLPHGRTIADLTNLVGSVRSSAHLTRISTAHNAAVPAAAIAAIPVAATNVAEAAHTPRATFMLHAEPDAWGWTDVESVAVTLQATLVNGHYYASVTNITGNYGIATRMLGRTEITGPGGNTTAHNYQAQLDDLDATSAGAQNWYMISAIRQHELVHAAHMQAALLAAEPPIQKRFSRLSVPAGGHVNSPAAAVTAMQALPAYQHILHGALAEWNDKYRIASGPDHGAAHNGPAYTAERTATQAMVYNISMHALMNGW